MKKLTNKIMMVMAVLFAAVTMVACDSADSATEKKLEGTWQFTYSEIEDGIPTEVYAVEEYSLPDHKFTTRLDMRLGYPINESLCIITYEGTWYATKKKIVNKIDKNSIEFSFNYMLDSSDRKDMEQEFIQGLKELGFEEGIYIRGSINDDSFTGYDDEDTEYNYRRIN